MKSRLCFALTLFALATSVRAQYPNVSKAIAAEAQARQEAAEKRSEEAFARALLVIKEWEGKGKPYLPGAAKPGAPVAEYLSLGFTHIWSGIDHLLYVLGLVLLVRKPRLLLKTITGFTLAHSASLAAASLGFIHVPTAPVEAVIALSILYVAIELLRSAILHSVLPDALRP